MKPKFLFIPLAAIITSTAMAGQFIWTGTEDNDWTNPANWDTTSSPPSTPGTETTFPAYGTDYTTDHLRIINGANTGVIYDAGPGVTTTFRQGRGLIVGVSGIAGDLTVSSGTLAIAGNDNPLMANGVSANLLINGGAIDVTGGSAPFHLVFSGTENLASNLTMTSGSFTAVTFDFFRSGTLGEGTINLEGGTLAVNRFLKASGAAQATLNLNGGTLRARNNNTNYLNAFAGLSVFANENGGTIDTDGNNITISTNIGSHPDLNGGPDGGLIKTGAGNLTLTGDSSFNGGVLVNEGILLLVSSDTAAGTGTITLADTGTAVQMQPGRTFENPFTILDNGDVKALRLVNSGSITLNGDITIEASGSENFQVRSDSDAFFTINGLITGTGTAGLHKIGGGWLNLRNPNNDFTGGVKVSGGILNFDNGTLGSGPVTLDGGTLRWRPGFANEDISDRLVMLDGTTAILNTGNDGVTFVTFDNAIGNNSTATLEKQGSGWLTLTQPSTYTGGTIVQAGILNFETGGLGTTGNITMAGGSLRWREGNSEDISSRLVFQDGSTTNFLIADGTVTFANPVGNGTTAGHTKGGGGTLTLTGTQTYSGPTTILAGTLQVDGTLDAASDVTVEGGLLGGSGTVPGNVTLLEGGGIAPGSPTGTLTINGNLDVSAAAAGAGTLRFGLAALAATSDQLAVGGSLTIGTGDLGFSDFQFTDLGGLEEGAYTLVTSTSLVGSLDAADLSGAIGGFTGTLDIVGDSLVLNVATSVASGYEVWSGGLPFNGDASGDGIANGIAWVLGAADPSADALELMPTIDNASDPDFLIFTFRRLQDAEADSEVTIAAETSTNLADWTTATAGPNVEINVTTNGAAPGIDLVDVKIHRSLANDGRIFVRLNVEQTAPAS